MHEDSNGCCSDLVLGMRTRSKHGCGTDGLKFRRRGVDLVSKKVKKIGDVVGCLGWLLES